MKKDEILIIIGLNENNVLEVEHIPSNALIAMSSFSDTLEDVSFQSWLNNAQLGDMFKVDDNVVAFIGKRK